MVYLNAEILMDVVVQVNVVDLKVLDMITIPASYWFTTVAIRHEESCD